MQGLGLNACKVLEFRAIRFITAYGLKAHKSGFKVLNLVRCGLRVVHTYELKSHKILRLRLSGFRQQKTGMYEA